MGHIKVDDVVLLLSVQSLDACEKLKMLSSGELIVKRVELRTNTHRGKDLVDSPVDLRPMQCHPTLRLWDRCSQDVESGRFTRTVGTEQPKRLSLLDNE